MTHSIQRASLVAALVLAVLVLPLVACNDSEPTPTAVSLGGQTGSLTLEMMDAPVDDVAELRVWVSGLDLKPVGGPVVRLRPPELQAGLYDLLQLRDGVSVILFDAEVPAGQYEFIEIELDASRSFLVEKSAAAELPLQIASGKTKLLGGSFGVRADGSTTVLFDFDAEKSLKRRGNGSYLLEPVLRVVRTSESA
jgi:hypothetical protein